MQNLQQNTDLKKFNITDAAIAELSNKYLSLTIKDINDKEGYNLIKSARIYVKGRRIEIEKQRKEFKDFYLQTGRAIDAEAKRIIAMLEPVEKHLEEQQQAIDEEKERIKAEAESQRQAKIQRRINLYSQEGLVINFAKIANTDDETFQKDFEEAMTIKKIEDARLEAEEARIIEETRLRQEREEAERLAEQEYVTAIQREVDAIKAAQDAEAARLAAITEEQARNQRAFDEKVAEQAEKERKIQAEFDKLDRQKEIAREVEAAREKERLNAELRAKSEAEAKIEKARIEKIEAARIEALKPDKEKLEAFAASIDSLPRPDIKDEAVYGVLCDVIEKLKDVVCYLHKHIAKLG